MKCSGHIRAMAAVAAAFNASPHAHAGLGSALLPDRGEVRTQSVGKAAEDELGSTYRSLHSTGAAPAIDVLPAQVRVEHSLAIVTGEALPHPVSIEFSSLGPSDRVSYRAAGEALNQEGFIKVETEFGGSVFLNGGVFSRRISTEGEAFTLTDNTVFGAREASYHIHSEESFRSQLVVRFPRTIGEPVVLALGEDGGPVRVTNFSSGEEFTIHPGGMVYVSETMGGRQYSLQGADVMFLLQDITGGRARISVPHHEKLALIFAKDEALVEKDAFRCEILRRDISGNRLTGLDMDVRYHEHAVIVSRTTGDCIYLADPTGPAPEVTVHRDSSTQPFYEIKDVQALRAIFTGSGITLLESGFVQSARLSDHRLREAITISSDGKGSFSRLGGYFHLPGTELPERFKKPKKGTIARAFYEAGSPLVVLPAEGFRAEMERCLEESLPKLTNAAMAAAEHVLPKEWIIDKEQGVYALRGVGLPKSKGTIDVWMEGDVVTVTGTNLDGPYIAQIARAVTDTLMQMHTASEIAQKTRDFELVKSETIRRLEAAGLTPDHITFVREHFGELLGEFKLPSAAKDAIRGRRVRFDEVKVSQVSFNFAGNPSSESGSSFSLKMRVTVPVDGLVNNVIAGRAAGTVVGAVGDVVGGAGRGLADITKDIPVVKWIATPFAFAGKGAGEVFHAGETVVNAGFGSILVEIDLELEGRQDEGGKWVITPAHRHAMAGARN